MTRKGAPMEAVEAVLAADTDDCVPWQFGRHPRGGYGSIWLGRTRKVTHVVLEMDGRPRPSPDHDALHSCDTPPCFNPRHLRWGLPVDNTGDMIARGRRADTTRIPLNVVRDVVRRRAAGELQRVIAADLGISQSQVSRFEHGLDRGHLTADLRVEGGAR